MRIYSGLAFLAFAACGSAYPPSPEPAARATWYQDVAPIVSKHCMSCHQPGGIAPFSLMTYEDAQPNATRMATQIDAGKMPPFDAREEADCTPRFNWQDDPRLSTAEIDTIKLWIEDGKAEGTPEAAPPIPNTNLSGVTKTLTPVVPFTATGTRDQFICYVPDPQTTGTWLTGLQIKPGNPNVVHHVVVTELMPGVEHDAVVAQRGIGMPWDCSDTQTPGGFVVNIWTPGNQ